MIHVLIVHLQHVDVNRTSGGEEYGPGRKNSSSLLIHTFDQAFCVIELHVLGG